MYFGESIQSQFDDKIKQINQILLDRDQEWDIAPPRKKKSKANISEITNLQDAMYLSEGGSDLGSSRNTNNDQQDSKLMELIFKKTHLSVKIFWVLQIAFVGMNIFVEVVFLLYMNKISINQDRYNCFVGKDDKVPSPYDNGPKSKSLDDLIKDPNVTNVTDQYDKIFAMNKILYIIFDSYLACLVLRYLNTKIRKQNVMEAKVLLLMSMILFTGFIGLGSAILIEAFSLRNSPAGKVCSGDFLKGDEKYYIKN